MEDAHRGAIKRYRGLKVWQKAHELAKQVIGISKTFPRTEEATIVRRQILRCATSIPANIAEGFGGAKGRVFRNCLVTARREAIETISLAARDCSLPLRVRPS